jgi:hypothetical protein
VVDGSNGKLTHESDSARAAGFGPQRRGDADVVDMRGHRHVRPVAYLVLPNAEAPFLLARVRWPDVYQAISAVRTDWQDDPGLFDLPYAPASVHISYEDAVEIAEGWGARIPSEEADQQSGPSLIRRMPSDWSSLSTAERRAWSIEFEKPARRALANAAAAAMERAASPDVSPSNAPIPTTSPVKRRRWGRRREPAVANGGMTQGLKFAGAAAPETLVIDLTEQEAVRATADSA